MTRTYPHDSRSSPGSIVEIYGEFRHKESGPESALTLDPGLTATACQQEAILALAPDTQRERDSQSQNISGPRACPYPFPILWHRNMARVMADEAREVAA